ncbi:MAG: S8 family serine peptidase [Bdellovibrionota bacterium]
MLKYSRYVWSLAALGSAGAGLFLGSGDNAHSDISKFATLLSQHARRPGEVIVKVKPAALATASLSQIFDAGRFRIAEIKAFETNKEFYTVKLAGDEQTAQYLEASASNPALQYAEPNYLLHIEGFRDDAPAEKLPAVSEFGMLWGMKNVGQKDAEGTVGVTGADIGATKALALTTGNKDVTIAVIDTGMDYTHPELKDNVFQNKADCFNDGVDHDGNGFVNDCHGWNFAAGASTNNPMDDNEHGTHVSGTIGANGDGGGHIAGVNWHTSIMPVKFLDGQGSGSLDDAVKAIQYATKMHVKIMSNSWGGGGFSQAMMDAITEAKNQGILFVAAAGNDSDNADSTPHYPASYQVDNVISVAASTNRDTLATFSTYGKRTVHIAAPGHKIYSSVPGGKYDNFSGTSMATPHVSGAAALVWGANMNLNYAQIKDRLLKSRDYVPTLTRKVASSGRLNVYNALMGIYPPSPEPAESAWQDFDMGGKTIETDHPYANNANLNYEISGPANAKFMRVVFSQVDLEDNYDKVQVLDANGNEMDSITGKSDNTAAFYVTGNKLTLHFTSDNSENRWGFKVAKVQVVY